MFLFDSTWKPEWRSKPKWFYMKDFCPRKLHFLLGANMKWPGNREGWYCLLAIPDVPSTWYLSSTFFVYLIAFNLMMKTKHIKLVLALTGIMWNFKIFYIYICSIPKQTRHVILGFPGDSPQLHPIRPSFQRHGLGPQYAAMSWNVSNQLQIKGTWNHLTGVIVSPPQTMYY